MKIQGKWSDEIKDIFLILCLFLEENIMERLTRNEFLKKKQGVNRSIFKLKITFETKSIFSSHTS